MLPFYLILLSLVVAIFSSNAVNKGDFFGAMAEQLVIHTIVLEAGRNIGYHVKNRLVAHLSAVETVHICVVENIKAAIDSYSENSSVYNHQNQSKCIHTIFQDLSNAKQPMRNVLFLSLGNSSLSTFFLNNSMSNRHLEMESFLLESYCLEDILLLEPRLFSSTFISCNSIILVADGLPLHIDAKNISFNPNDIHYGAVVGAYAAMERLGFSFLHPLQPYIPPHLFLSLPQEGKHIRTAESPHWPHRAFHIHTQHPLELTEVLQGHDIPQFGPHGPHCKRFSSREHNADAASTGYCERWEDMGEVSIKAFIRWDNYPFLLTFTHCYLHSVVKDVDSMFEWAVANRCNRLEWLLLGNYKWGDELDTRQRRLQILTDLGHKYSLLIGADSPLGNIQQHGWSMVNTRLSLTQQRKQIRDRVDWIFRSGFDFLTTESGLSEFTHPECELMLELMNEFAIHVNVTWGREAAIKVHCSTGQICDGYLDPRSDEPINFNFLPTFAHAAMGVFPHTVQVYALDDPTAGAYGNNNFSYIEDYLVYEAKRGNRSVIFYPETAYWVNVDVDVPLFLPIYAQRRQHDLRRLAVREARESFRMQGQMVFDSGWEWGLMDATDLLYRYWLNDVVASRAAWDPMVDLEAAVEKADYQVVDDMWGRFRESLHPFAKIFGPVYGARVAEIIVDLTLTQERLLIEGRIGSAEFESLTPSELKKLTGIAYLSGGDTWVDVPRLFGVAFTQPDKVRQNEKDDRLWPAALALLREMSTAFAHHLHQMQELLQDIQLTQEHEGAGVYVAVSPSALSLLSELADGIELLSLRSDQLLALYTSRDKGGRASEEETDRAPQGAPGQTSQSQSRSQAAELHMHARSLIQQAQVIVTKREQQYRVPWQRVAMWRENPTVYRFGYLWAVHSLYYWWRDQGLAEEGSSISITEQWQSPCYLNRMDVSEVAVGWGKYTLELMRSLLGLLGRYMGPNPYLPLDIVNCLSPPTKEYQFPKDLYHAE